MAIALMEGMTGKSEEATRAALAEALHAGDYAAACRRIAQLEIALRDVEDQHADLKRAYDLAQGTAEVLTSKIVDVKSKKIDVGKTESFLQVNQQFGTDPATESFLAGKAYEPSFRAWKKGRKNIEKVVAWLVVHGVRRRGIETAALSASEDLSIGFRTVQPIVSKWVKKNGYSEPGKKI